MDVLSAAIGATQDADVAAAVAAVVTAGAAQRASSLSSKTTNDSRADNDASTSREPSGTSIASSAGTGGDRREDMDDEEDEAVPPSSGGTGGQSASGSGVASGAAAVAVAPVAHAAVPPLVQVAPAVDPAAAEAHALLELQRKDIEEGKHPRMAEEEARQSDLKRRRVDVASDRNRLLLLNVDELRKAEIRDSEIQTKVALEKTQEELLDDVHQRIRKAKVDGGLVVAKGAARTIAAEAVEGSAGKEGDRAGAMLLAGRKRARLMPARTYEKVTPEGVLAKAEARRVRSVTLSDIEMRKDFQAIIVDWRERATKYLSTYNNSHWTKVSVSADSFRVRGVTFTKGDPVVVTSRVTGEEFHGEITVVKPKAVFLSLYGGVKTRIFVDHISTGRLTVARADVKSNL